MNKTSENQNKLVIFDFDGVIALNTEEITMSVIKNKINNDYFNGKNIVTLSDCFKNFIGLSKNELFQKIKQIYNLEFDNDKFGKDIRDRRIIEIKKQNRIILDNYLTNFLDNLKNNNIKFCILSSSSVKPLDIAIKNTKLCKYFKIKGKNKNVFSIEEIGWKTKKDLYILIRNILYKNYEIFAIEDSLNGLLSTIKSNIPHVIIYRNKYNQKNIKGYYNTYIFKKNIMIRNFNDQKLKELFFKNRIFKEKI